MKKYKGYLMALISGLVFIFLTNKNMTFDLYRIVGATIGTLILPLVISGVIYFLSKNKKDFGLLFGYTTVITCIICYIGLKI
jgi:hypothetical protein